MNEHRQRWYPNRCNKHCVKLRITFGGIATHDFRWGERVWGPATELTHRVLDLVRRGQDVAVAAAGIPGTWQTTKIWKKLLVCSV